MKKIDAVILTEPRYINDAKEADIHNVFIEDHLVVEALIKKGYNAIRLSWDDTSFDWNQTKSIVFRSIWDYTYRFREFFEWLEKVSALTQLINSKELIYWNIDKHYLLDLKEKSINIPETYIIEKGHLQTLSAILNKLKWDEVVLKPCVSAGARHTYRFKSLEASKYESIFQKLIAEEAFIIQPFQKQVLTKGEVSIMMFNGVYSHAILKLAKPGDFRVQDDFGGTIHHYEPSDKEIDFAKRCIEACPELPTYARVDYFWDNDNELALAELELIEPELWFRENKNAAELMADGIIEKQ